PLAVPTEGPNGSRTRSAWSEAGSRVSRPCDARWNVAGAPTASGQASDACQLPETVAGGVAGESNSVRKKTVLGRSRPAPWDGSPPKWRLNHAASSSMNGYLGP